MNAETLKYLSKMQEKFREAMGPVNLSGRVKDDQFGLMCDTTGKLALAAIEWLEVQKVHIGASRCDIV